MQRLRYPEVAPEGYAALRAFGHYLNTATALEPVLKELVELRCSQLNGCEFCIEAHRAELRKHHEPDTRIDGVVDWRGPGGAAFTPRERAALAWAETLTLLAAGARADDEAYATVSEFFAGKDLVDLTYAIANINAFNRLGTAFRPEWKPKKQADTVDAVGDDGGKVVEE